MGLEVIVRGTLGKDCPHSDNLPKLKKSMEQVIRKRLELRPQDAVTIIFRNKTTTNENGKVTAKVVFERGIGNFLPMEEVTDVDLAVAVKELNEELKRREG